MNRTERNSTSPLKIQEEHEAAESDVKFDTDISFTKAANMTETTMKLSPPDHSSLRNQFFNRTFTKFS